MLIDAHAHLDLYNDQINAALAEIEQRQIFTVSTAMDLPSYEKVQAIADRCEYVLPTFGIHPWNAPTYAERLSELDAAIERSPLIGEIGLDFHWVEDSACFPAQRKVLEYSLAAACEQDKVVNLHTKGAEEEILQLLDQYDIQRAIIHWYSGPLDVFRDLVARGCYFTIGVEVRFSEHIRTLAKELPVSQLLTETDNPGGEKWLAGNIGTPSVIQEVIAALASLKQTTPRGIEQTVQKNFLRLIDGDPWLSEARRTILSNKSPA